MRKYYLGHLAYPGANPNINIVNAFILFDHQQVVGAWITDGGVPGVHAVNEQIPIAQD